MRSSQINNNNEATQSTNKQILQAINIPDNMIVTYDTEKNLGVWKLKNTKAELLFENIITDKIENLCAYDVERFISYSQCGLIVWTINLQDKTLVKHFSTTIEHTIEIVKILTIVPPILLLIARTDNVYQLFHMKLLFKNRFLGMITSNVIGQPNTTNYELKKSLCSNRRLFEIVRLNFQNIIICYIDESFKINFSIFDIGKQQGNLLAEEQIYLFDELQPLKISYIKQQENKIHFALYNYKTYKGYSLYILDYVNKSCDHRIYKNNLLTHEFLDTNLIIFGSNTLIMDKNSELITLFPLSSGSYNFFIEILENKFDINAGLDTIKELCKKNSNLEDNTKQLSEKNDNLTKALNEKIKELDVEIAAHNSTQASYTEKKLELENKLKDSDKQIQKLKQKLKSRKVNHRKLTETLQKRTEENNLLNNEISNCKAKLLETQEENISINKTIEDLKKDIQDKEETIAYLNQQIQYAAKDLEIEKDKTKLYMKRAQNFEALYNKEQTITSNNKYTTFQSVPRKSVPRKSDRIEEIDDDDESDIADEDIESTGFTT